jgi:hypothetical protein
MASLHGSALQAEGDDILIAQQRTFIEAMVQQERPAERVDVANGSKSDLTALKCDFCYAPENGL